MFSDIGYALSISPWITGTSILTLLLSFLLNCVLLRRMGSVIGLRFNKRIDNKAESKYRKQMDEIATAIITLVMISYIFLILATRDMFPPSGLLVYGVVLFVFLILPSLLWTKRVYTDRHARNLLILINILQIILYSIIGFLILFTITTTSIGEQLRRESMSIQFDPV